MLANKKIPIYLSGAYGWWRISTLLIFGFMLVSVVMSGFFVYGYTTKTLQDAHTIVVLNTNSIVNTVNLENYEKAVQVVKLKSTASAVPANLRNIFVYVSLTSSTSSTTYGLTSSD